MTRKLFIVFLVCSCGLIAGAQSRSVWGVRLAMDVMRPAGGEGLYGTGAGFSLGGVYNLSLYKDKLYFEPGLLFYYETADASEIVLDNYAYESNAKNAGFRVPLNVGYNFNLLDNLRLSLYTGPQVNVNVSARLNATPNFSAAVPEPSQTIDLFKHGWKRVDAQWGFGLSLTFAGHYHLGLSGGVGFTPLAAYGNRDNKIKIRRNTFGISLGYNF